MKGTERQSLCEQSIVIARMERQCSKRSCKYFKTSSVVC